MSTWKEIKDPDDIDISDDNKHIEVVYDTDDMGNNYIEIPLKVVLEKLSERLG